ncbi:prolipoprotein diacylglyceryl transferase [Agromyces aurantiacus]|uniref:Prolipoprotein diacylglyceryl transferase n=1 Tax=Agromyces aurantiacus TaxID=165814 RepID=A0ABV9R2V2_9MICO|nr:prolipoprotein diacylglyceryl transferase family protein [Agromyces aurantiacus]MBM7506138.1 prolipoprotein diacylglyceryltransferase [Agromyces aurantiacus]
MAATLGSFWSALPPIDTHALFVALGLAVGGLVFLREQRRRGVADPRIPALLAGTLLGAAVFSRLGTWAQHLDPRENLTLLEQLARGNASILSALVGAWLGLHVAKRLTGYRERTGDLFAPAVAVALAIGRFGCFFTERPGTPTGADWGVVLSPEAAARLAAPAGVPLHPSFLYEIAFHAVAFCVLWLWLRRTRIASGELLTLYIGAYAVFRFWVEFVRGNEVVWMGLTRPQLFLVVTIPLFVARIAWLVAHGRFLDRVVPDAANHALHEQRDIDEERTVGGAGNG